MVTELGNLNLSLAAKDLGITEESLILARNQQEINKRIRKESLTPRFASKNLLQ